jgi:hypothetical protein
MYRWCWEDRVRQLPDTGVERWRFSRGTERIEPSTGTNRDAAGACIVITGRKRFEVGWVCFKSYGVVVLRLARCGNEQGTGELNRRRVDEMIGAEAQDKEYITAIGMVVIGVSWVSVS